MPNLTPIEEKLLDCAKKGQPVLLYGNDTIKRKDLVLKIHKMAIKTDAPTIIRDTNMAIPVKANKLIDAMTKQHYIDCGIMGGPGIKNTFLDICCNPAVINNAEISYPVADDLSPMPRVNVEFVRRLFFLDNVSCNTQEESDFKQAGKIVKKEDRKWIVLYAYKLDNFPPYFKAQFLTIDLESEARNTASEPQTPAGATGNPTPEANQRPQGKNKRKINKLFYTFDGKGGIELSSNCKDKPIMLTRQEGKLFSYLIL